MLPWRINMAHHEGINQIIERIVVSTHQIQSFGQYRILIDLPIQICIEIYVLILMHQLTLVISCDYNKILSLTHNVLVISEWMLSEINLDNS